MRLFIRFKQGTNMSVAYREVRDRVERAKVDFPADIAPDIHQQGGPERSSGLRHRHRGR